MYYKEEWINGKLYWKASPNGEWHEFTKQQYVIHCLQLEAQLNKSLKDRIFDLANDFAVSNKGNIAVELHRLHNELE